MPPSIQQAINICEQEKKAGRVPHLAILGPPGSGKTAYLHRLYEALTDRKWRAYANCLEIDLRHFPIGSSDDIFRGINSELIRLARQLHINIKSGATVVSQRQRFDSIIGDWLKSAKKHPILFFDHLDSVPRHFALDLKHHLRDFLQRETFYSIDSAADDQVQLGLIVAGAMSLFELRQDPMSPLLMCKPIILPQQDLQTRQELVKEQATARLQGRQVSDEIISYLAEATGGEPVFLIPLLDILSKNNGAPIDSEFVQQAIQQLYTYKHLDLTFWQLALHLWTDDELQRIVQQLNENTDVRPTLLDIDVDPYHLSGAVILEGRTVQKPYRKYRFRNTITTSFIKEIIAFRKRDDSPTPYINSILSGLRNLDHVKAECLRADALWEAIKRLKEAWTIVTPYRSSEDKPQISIYVTHDANAWGWWVDLTNKKIIGPEKRISQLPEGDAVRMSIYNAIQEHSVLSQPSRAFLGWNEELLSLAVSLSKKNASVFIVATLPRVRAGTEFTEFNLAHWIRFLHHDDVKRTLLNLTLAQFGLEHIEKTIQTQATYMNVHTDDAQKIYLSDSGVIWAGSSSVQQYEGEINEDDLAFINTTLKNWLMEYRNNSNVPPALTASLRDNLIYRFRESLKKIEGFPERLNQLKSSNHLIAVSNAEGLSLPLELFPYGKDSFLGLELPVTRQLYGVSVKREARATFSQLIDSLRISGEPLNVLLIASNPHEDLQAATSEIIEIKKLIEQGCAALEVKPNIETIEPDNATYDNLWNHLLQKNIHIFHYVGHGGALTEDRRSGLLLKDSKRGVQLIDYGRFKSLLRETNAQIWFAYINSCYGAQWAETSTDARGGGEALLSVGVPNFMGFREPISDESAKFFAEKFYRKLFSAVSLGEAVLAARIAAYAQTEYIDAWLSSTMFTM